MQHYTYKVKVFNGTKRSKFSVKVLHNVTRRFESVTSLRSALWHELGDIIPDERDFNMGYFEGKQHSKKWLTSRQDLDAMYAHFQGKQNVNLWCDGKSMHESDEETPVSVDKSKKSARERKREKEEEDLEQVFLQLKEKHSSTYSGPQLRLWARMVIAKTHDSLSDPPNVPMITGSGHARPRTESFSEAITNAATAFAKALSPPPPTSRMPTTSTSSAPPLCSPSKIVNVRMRNIEQLRALKQLFEDDVLTEEEFLVQKEIVLKSLTKLV